MKKRAMRTNIRGGGRNSNLELFRIITMLVIVAHHYVVNSGLLDMINESASLGVNDIFLLLFGWGGKTGINCFVLITGYFMCTKHITKKKFVKLLGEQYFYTILILLIFIVTGYITFGVKDLLKTVLAFFNVSTNFTSCFLLFYLFIPFLNKLINALTEKEHLWLMALCLFIYTFLPSFVKATVIFNYITWFGIIYIMASYIRLYPRKIYENTKLWGFLTVVSIMASWGSVIGFAWIAKVFGRGRAYFWVADSNKVMAVVTAVCAFLFFKNLKIRSSRLINTVASSTFGVLLIHANSDTMRRWLWLDTLNNVGYYNSPMLVLHAVISVAAVYIACTLIDQLRVYITVILLSKRDGAKEN